jgi:hypothetical protein
MPPVAAAAPSEPRTIFASANVAELIGGKGVSGAGGCGIPTVASEPGCGPSRMLAVLSEAEFPFPATCGDPPGVGVKVGANGATAVELPVTLGEDELLRRPSRANVAEFIAGATIEGGCGTPITPAPAGLELATIPAVCKSGRVDTPP